MWFYSQWLSWNEMKQWEIFLESLGAYHAVPYGQCVVLSI